MTEEVIKLSIQLEDAQKAIGRISDEMEDFKNETLESQKAIQDIGKDGNKKLGLLGKTVSKVGKGFRGAGLAVKAFIAGLGLKIFEKFTEILMQNQTIVDGLSVAFGTVSTVFTKFIDGIVNAGQEFTALGDIVKNSVMVPINLLKTTIFGVQTGLLNAQLAWEKSFLGGNDAEKIKELQADIDRVNGKLDDAAGGLVDNVVGIGKGFIQTGKELGDFATKAIENTKEISATQELANQKRIQQLRNETAIALAENDKLQLEFQLAAERQRQKRDDVTKSIDDRIKANDELKNVLQEQFDLQLANAQKALELAQAELRANPKLIENKVALIEAEKNLFDVKESIAGFESEQLTNRAALELEEIELTNSLAEAENARAIAKKLANAEEIEDELEKLEKLKQISEEEEALEVARFEKEIERLGIGTQARQDAEQQLLDFMQEKELEQQDFDNQIFDVKKQRSDEEENMEQKVADVKKGLVMDGLSLIIAAAGEGSKIGKMAAIAQATISGIEGTINAFKTAQDSQITKFFPAYPFVQAGLAAGFAAVNIAKIKSTPAMGGSGGGSGPSAQGQAPAFNIVGEAPENQLATAIGEKDQEPVKAFVVSDDVTTAQALDRKIENNASI